MTRKWTLEEIADLVGGEVEGDGTLQVSGLNAIELAGPGEITFVTGARAAKALADSRATACICPPDLELPRAMPCVRVNNPEYAAALIHTRFLAEPFAARGIHPTAVIGEECSIPEEISIGPLAVIGDRVRIGPRVTIFPGVVIGDDCVIGEDTVLHANVSIGRDTVIGARVIIHAGASIGSDGFGFATDPATGTHLKKPQVGNVRIDDDVEIGANTCVDRAAFGTTRIRSGAKIDNLVMVAHNVEVGENSILVGQVGIAGSTTLGRNVVLGGKAAIAGHLHIGDRVMVAAMGGVHTSLPEGAVVGGAPAFDVKRWGRATAVFSRLPEMQQELRKLRREVKELKKLLSQQAVDDTAQGEGE